MGEPQAGGPEAPKPGTAPHICLGRPWELQVGPEGLRARPGDERGFCPGPAHLTSFPPVSPDGAWEGTTSVDGLDWFGRRRPLGVWQSLATSIRLSRTAFPARPFPSEVSWGSALSGAAFLSHLLHPFYL